MYFSLESAGFTNIQPEPLYDLPSGDERRGKIESVVIEGKSDFARGDIFPKDTLIATNQIKYASFRSFSAASHTDAVLSMANKNASCRAHACIRV